MPGYSSCEVFFLIPTLDLPWHNLMLFPLVLSLVTWEKSPTPIWLHPPVREVSRARMCPHNLLFSSLSPPSFLSCSCCSRPFPSSVPFSGSAPASQCLSCQEVPRSDPRTGGTSAVPSTGNGHCPGPAATPVLIQARCHCSCPPGPTWLISRQLLASIPTSLPACPPLSHSAPCLWLCLRWL